ncbi:hypothetical protein G3N57_14055 [Paraburkholderia sp. Se-20369]|nr:hypothetical protein [Paraburkholderia sp. Se-20369]
MTGEVIGVSMRTAVRDDASIQSIGELHGVSMRTCARREIDMSLRCVGIDG